MSTIRQGVAPVYDVPQQIKYDAGGRMRVSQITTLGDYRCIGFDKSLLLDNVGTGSGAFSNNKYTLSVTTGKYFIRQSHRYHPYFSGKSQLVECTFDKFHKEAGITKRIGYFSSSQNAPYTDNLDGFFLENDGSDYYIKCYRDGVETVSIPSQGWDGLETFHDYDWSFFTVVIFEFLWLGGAVLRIWIKGKTGFDVLHTVHYAGTSENTFIKSPHQPVRYELRSSSGGGSLRYICAQVGTEGSIEESGSSRSVKTGSTAITLAAIGTSYPVISIQKQSAYRDIPVMFDHISILVASANDRLLWELQINPTLSAPLTYGAVSNSAINFAVGDGIITVSGAGTSICGGYLVQGQDVDHSIFKNNFFAWLGSTPANVMDQFVLVCTPLTGNIATFATMDYKEY